MLLLPWWIRWPNKTQVRKDSNLQLFGTSKAFGAVPALPFGATDLYTAFTGSGYPVNRSTSDIVAGDGLEPPTHGLKAIENVAVGFHIWKHFIRCST